MENTNANKDNKDLKSMTASDKLPSNPIVMKAEGDDAYINQEVIEMEDSALLSAQPRYSMDEFHDNNSIPNVDLGRMSNEFHERVATHKNLPTSSVPYKPCTEGDLVVTFTKKSPCPLAKM